MTELLLPMHGNMCVFGLKSFKFVLRGSAPRPWLVMQTHQAETRNPKPSGKMGETRNPDAAEKRNPKPKPGRNPAGGRPIALHRVKTAADSLRRRIYAGR